MKNIKKKVLIASPVHKLLLEKLKSKGFIVFYYPSIKKIDLIKLIKVVNILILRSGITLDKKILSKSNNLKIIARAGVGLDNIDTEYAKKKGIIVFNASNISFTSVAEFTIGLLIAASRNITLSDRQLRINSWKKSELYGHELNGKTLGIVGLGKIGSEVAKISKAFSMKILANVKDKKKKRKNVNKDIKLVSFKYLLKNSDFISFHVPLKKDTKNLLDSKKILLLKKNAVLVNMSRGGVINENALYTHLKKRKIFAAATDVFLFEKRRSKLFSLNNIVVTTHIGAMTYEAQKSIANEIFNKIVNKKI